MCGPAGSDTENWHRAPALLTARSTFAHSSPRSSRISASSPANAASADELDGILDAQLPDLVVLGVSVDGIEAGKILEMLVRKEFGGKVLVIGAAELDHRKGRAGKLATNTASTMLPPLPTPFSAGSLRDQCRGPAAGRAGAKPGSPCRRGAEGRLARIVVSAEDRCPHAGPLRRGSAGADAASHMGRGAAGLLHSGRATIRISMRCRNS